MSDKKPSLAEIFRELGRATAESAQRGAVLYASQAKTMLTTAFPGFSEQEYGFEKFIELLRNGDNTGQYTLEIFNGHPRLVLPGSNQTDFGNQDAWLKPDLWNAMLTWGAADRYWDRSHGRAYFVPTDGTDGSPLWVSSPDNFVSIDPVTFDKQLAWMREFIDTVNDDHQEELRRSLSSDQRGAFIQALTRLGLHSDWKTFLRRKVVEHTTQWAKRSGIASNSVFDIRTTRLGRKSTTESLHKNRSTPSGLGTTQLEENLRARLHRVIDQMSISELMALQIPAIYLARE